MTVFHWDERYRRSPADALSWYEATPLTSLELIGALGTPLDASVVDVGGGESHLVDHLLNLNFTDLTVVDISAGALDASRRRLGDAAGERVSWRHQDIRTWQPLRQWDVWHDRAVFHFMIDPADRAGYLAALGEGLAPGGSVILGTFASDGPESCSGLPVARYGPDDLVVALEEVRRFDVVVACRREHTTPWGVMQPFSWLAARALS